MLASISGGGGFTPDTVQFSGSHVQFLKLDTNEQGKWLVSSECLRNLTKHLLASVCVSGVGQKLSTDPTENVECRVCSGSFQRVVLRTHVAQHLLRGECVPGEEELCPGNACGFCGGRKGCSVSITKRGTKPEIVTSLCPLRPHNVRFRTLSKGSGQNPATNHPRACAVCNSVVWSFSMESHYAGSHAGTPCPVSECVLGEERERVLRWDPASIKKKAKPNPPPTQPREGEGPHESPQKGLGPRWLILF